MIKNVDIIPPIINLFELEIVRFLVVSSET